MPARRLQAPAANRGVLAEPGCERIPSLIRDNLQKLNRTDVRIAGIPLPDLRVRARREVLAAAAAYTPDHPAHSLLAPLFLAGHQPELSHPGVWVKHFALTALARQIGGTALNLVVDNDTLKRATLHFPIRTDDGPDAVRHASVPFDRSGREEPYEIRAVHDPDLFGSFVERAAPACANWGFEPLLPRVWRDVIDSPAATIGEKFAGVRRKWERDWGCQNLELPVSRLCRTEAFRWFVQHVLGDLPRFRDVYNAALEQYRRQNGLRSRNHPAPDLGPAEAPFWTQFADGRRGRATARSDPATVRPRALTLTLFARVCLGDFFLHGIGGGKYDEVTDAIIRDYFGLEPPAYQVLSATLHLPLPAFPADAATLRELARCERDLYWNPQRHLTGGEDHPQAAQLMRRHRELASNERADREGRRERYQELRRIVEQLRPFVGRELDCTRTQRHRAEQEVAANAVLRRRDYAWVLYPEAELRPFLQRFLTAVWK
jgi:hypothetical protein